MLILIKYIVQIKTGLSLSDYHLYEMHDTRSCSVSRFFLPQKPQATVNVVRLHQHDAPRLFLCPCNLHALTPHPEYLTAPLWTTAQIKY